MKELTSSVEKAAGTSWSALVTHQVFVGLGLVLLSLIVFAILYYAFKKLNVMNNLSPIIVLIVILVVGIDLALFGYGLMHVFNPGYYALQEIKEVIK